MLTTLQQAIDAWANGNVRAGSRVVRQGESSQQPIAYRMRWPGLGKPVAYFDDMSKHPQIFEPTTGGQRSSAAGAYQFTWTTWNAIHRKYQFLPTDFSEHSQDLAFVCLLDDCGALQYLINGEFEKFIWACTHPGVIWTSLPGGTENPQSMANARAVYELYGGTYASDTQPAAPIEDRSTEYKEPTVAGKIGFTDILAGVAGMFNPLAGKLIEVFAPMVQDKIAKEINRHTDDPAIGVEIAKTISDSVVSQASVLTGKPDPFDAVAAVRADPALLAQIEQSTDSYINRLTDVAKSTMTFDEAMWRAQNTGKQTVSSIAIEEKKAGLYDMTKALVWNASFIVTAGSIALLGTIAYQSSFVEKGIDPVLLALAGPLLMQAFNGLKDIIAYRFDGTKDSSAQTNALLNAATIKKG